MRISDWSSDVCSSDLHVVALRRLAARIARGTGVARRLLRGGHGREQRLRGFLQRLGLGLDLRLVVALHRGLELGDRTLDAADQVARHLVAVVLDRAARAVDQRVGLVAGGDQLLELPVFLRSEEHTSELQSLMRISYAVFCLTKKKDYQYHDSTESH